LVSNNFTSIKTRFSDDKQNISLFATKLEIEIVSLIKMKLKIISEGLGVA